MTRLTADWLTEPGVVAVMAALDDQGYFVGGAVRDTLLGMPVGDVDIATALLPEDVAVRAEAAGLRAIPTGIDHGTVTLVAEGRAVEVTTFRADVSTDGRRATVRFSTDIAEDARRRDFTMNALYATADGRLIDPLGGLADLTARRLRFIGDAHDRIREDYLRILRFFRFHAWYGGQGTPDDAGMTAVRELAQGITRLARERIGAEIKKLLAAPDPVPALTAMVETGVLARCLSGVPRDALTVQAGLIARERAAGRAPDWLARLAVLEADDPGTALRLSRSETGALTALAEAREIGWTPAECAYRKGAETAWRVALIAAARAGDALPEALAREIAQGAEAALPLTAIDLIAAGLAPGPALGAALARAETAWLASGFSLDKAALIGEALDKGQHK